MAKRKIKKLKPLVPHLYCDKHVDHASNPDLVMVCQKHNRQKIVHKAQGGYPHPTLCGQFITMGFNAAESDDEVTCTKCLNRMKSNG